MDRKDFIKGLAATLGSLALARESAVASFPTALSQIAADGDGYFWKLVRDQFVLDPEWTYLNLGGLGTCPLPVLNSLREWTRSEELSPSAGHDAKLWSEVKTKLAGALGKTCRSEDLGLISCATEGVNIIINGLPLKKGDEVITSTHEHMAVNVGLLNRMQKDGIVIRLFEPDTANGLGNVDRIAALINGRTRLILISHVTCTTGQRFPEKELSKLAHERGIWFALDGAQAPGCVPFDIVDIGVDFYTCSTHKWIMAPKRTGFIYVRQGLLETLRPIVAGASTFESFDIKKNELVLHPTAQRYEYGTQNDALFYGLGTAIDFCNTIGFDRIFTYNQTMAERFHQELLSIPHIEVVSPKERIYRSPMISFRMKNHDYREIMDHLVKDKIRVRAVREGGCNCIRVSFHICNHNEEVTKILDSLKKLSGV